MRFTIDSNILVYAVASGSPDLQIIARDILIRAMNSDAVLTAQAVGEFLNVMRRKFPPHYPAALAEARRWSTLFAVAPTSCDAIFQGAAFAARYRLQFWDGVIWQVARSMGASIFLSEDLQDGFSADGMTVLNPFIRDNHERLEEIFAG